MSETLVPVACCAPLGATMLSEEEALATAAVFRSLGDPARVKIVNLLATRREPLSADEFVTPLGLAQPTVSHHLKKLTEAGLLDREQRGKFAYFTLNADALRTLAAVVDLSLDPPICAGGAPVWARQAASRPGFGPVSGPAPGGCAPGRAGDGRAPARPSPPRPVLTAQPNAPRSRISVDPG